MLEDMGPDPLSVMKPLVTPPKTYLYEVTQEKMVTVRASTVEEAARIAGELIAESESIVKTVSMGIKVVR